MTQHTDIVLPESSYTRADYAAMRAYVQRIPIHFIADRYYMEDSPQVRIGLERFLIGMRDDLVERAIEHNPHFADILKNARQGGTLTVKALDILIKAADAPKSIPHLNDPISKWFRPKTVMALRSENIATTADLVKLINRRGASWWRSIPRIGALRAKVITQWINANSITLGEVSITDEVRTSAREIEISPARPSTMVPIEAVLLPIELDGAHGINRCQNFCFIQARDDRDALLAYLQRFSSTPDTFRSYRKELERLLLWSIIIQRKPLSSLLVDDCESYKSFLVNPAPTFIGLKVPRTSSRWKPFDETKIAPKSQKRALGIIRACFKYLVDVRYLAGNPWVVVKDPSVTEEIHPIKIERALPQDLWEQVVAHLQEQAKLDSHAQDRIALAAMLLMGDSGMRRHEVAKATRNKLRLHQLRSNGSEQTIYTLEVNGKGNKNRLVPVSERTISALKLHFADRKINFDEVSDSSPLLSPLIIPSHQAAIEKHERLGLSGYSRDSLYPIIARVWKNLRKINTEISHFSVEDLDRLAKTSPHAFRHTFGTLSLETEMPIDVIQSILGHASITTTGIYSKTREKRMLGEALKFFNGSKKQ